MSSADPAAPKMQIVYDGECPFCSNFVRLYQLRENVGVVDLVDARTTPDLVASFRQKGIEIDNGMVVLWEGRTYYGADAMTLLAMLGAQSGAFATLNRWLFREPRLAKLIYPVLVFGRRATLALLGRKPFLTPASP